MNYWCLYFEYFFSDNQYFFNSKHLPLVGCCRQYLNKNSNDTNLCWKFGRMMYVLLEVFSSTAVSVIFYSVFQVTSTSKTYKMESLTTLHCGKNGSVTFQLWPTGVFKSAITEGVYCVYKIDDTYIWYKKRHNIW